MKIVGIFNLFLENIHNPLFVIAVKKCFETV